MYLKCIPAKYICIWLYLQAPAPYFPSRLGMQANKMKMSHDAISSNAKGTKVMGPLEQCGFSARLRPIVLLKKRLLMRATPSLSCGRRRGWGKL